jgi:C4-dicarboxylate-specific signal transduction histidine kinase
MRELSPQHEEHWYEVYGRVASTGEPIRFENHAELLNRWYDVYAFRFGAAGNRQVAILFNDITRRKESEVELRRAKDELEARVAERTRELAGAMERLRSETEERIQAVEELRRKEQLLIQQSRLAAMGEMLVNISHQWRQPLNLLGLILQDLDRTYRRGSFSPEFVDSSVDRAMQVIEHMSRTIDDFRNFFIPDKSTRLFSVREVVETTVSMIRDSFKDLRPDLRIEARDDVSILGYRNEYAQVVMNILINARDVFRERKVASPVIVVKIVAEEGRSVVTIADNAGGIAGEVIDRIFDPYFTTKDPDQGTGVGLFMSKTIIEKNMKGSLTVRNTGIGAEFRIEV